MDVLKIKLRWGRDLKAGERMAGHWMVWAKGEGDEALVCYERIRRRDGDMLVGERHTRLHLGEAWVVHGDYDLDAHWPPYPGLESLGCEPLPREEAARVISAAIEALEEVRDGEVD